MRTFFFIMMVIVGLIIQAQTPSTVGNRQLLQPRSFTGNNHFTDSVPAKKWFVTKYIGLSAGINMFNNRVIPFMSVPIGLQLNRRLSNNWYAFAGVAVAPTFTNFNQPFLTTNKTFNQNNFMQTNRLGMYSKAEMGLMYINDQKTFSISASISIEKSSYPIVPFNQLNATKPNVLLR